jgi:hypothetical protein
VATYLIWASAALLIAVTASVGLSATATGVITAVVVLAAVVTFPARVVWRLHRALRALERCGTSPLPGEELDRLR